MLGALDISGPSHRADPRMLQLARMLGVTVEQALLARAYRRQTVVLSRYAELTARFPNDALLALDSDGRVLQATGVAKARGLPPRLKLPGGVTFVAGNTQAPWLEGASVYPVHDEDGSRIGACLVAREKKRSSRRAAPSSRAHHRFEDVVGLRDAVALARSASTTSMPVLLLGETGVGKEVLAQAIHSASSRADAPFIAVNCAALPASLVESELFGYVGGAFSGARSEGAPGRFEAAHGGTLFLDEVGELPLHAQAALLRALQERVITPVGSTESLAIDVRIVSATNRNLDEAVKQGSFRLDLLHRLNVIAVAVPPLRERPEEIGPLVEQLSARIEHETGLVVRLSPVVRDALTRHAWPGNVRELDNVLRRLALLAREREVTLGDLPFSASASLAATADSQVQKLLDVIHSARNMAEAATRLGVNRSTLYRQLERLGLTPGRTAQKK
jgi:transcriptional regulator with PAS, ATPase and Fis domain